MVHECEGDAWGCSTGCVVAGLIDRVLEERARNTKWILLGFAVIAVALVALPLAGRSGFLGGAGGLVGATLGWFLQLELYDRARRRNLEVARAGGLR